MAPYRAMSPAPGRVVVEAPAKVNLTLHVTGRRDDGYHLLDSLVVFADMGDLVTVREADEPGQRVLVRFHRLSLGEVVVLGPQVHVEFPRELADREPEVLDPFEVVVFHPPVHRLAFHS